MHAIGEKEERRVGAHGVVSQVPSDANCSTHLSAGPLPFPPSACLFLSFVRRSYREFVIQIQEMLCKCKCSRLLLSDPIKWDGWLGQRCFQAHAFLLASPRLSWTCAFLLCSSCTVGWNHLITLLGNPSRDFPKVSTVFLFKETETWVPEIRPLALHFTGPETERPVSSIYLQLQP